MLYQRILTALVLAPIMIGGIFFLPLTEFALFIGLIVVLGGWEWTRLAGIEGMVNRVAYVGVLVLLMAGLYYNPMGINAALLYKAVLWVALIWWVASLWFVKNFPKLPAFCFKTSTLSVLGVVVLVPMWVGLMTLKTLQESNFWIIYLMLIVWGADVGAYVVGRAIGRRKLAPNVSPGKSWEGVFGGLLAVMLIAMVAGLMLSDTLEFDLSQWLGLFGVSIVVFIISILGDLVESVAKRHRGIKDSSKLLPGHGGIMDRIDSLTAAVPVFALLLTMVVI
jgi:phosphatidate cytidylyltransferase